jgi:hypothetical protein
MRIKPFYKLKVLPLVEIITHEEEKEKKFKSPLEKPSKRIKEKREGIVFYR